MGAFDIGFFRRANWVFQQMFGGKRNLYDVFGYTLNPTFDHRFMKYLRQDIAARIVDAPADALWTSPPLISSNEPAWNELWDDLPSRFNLYSVINRADRLCGIGRFSLLLIGYNDGGNLDKPVNTRAITQKKDKILYLQPYSERCVQIIKYNDDATSEDFMKPEMYRITPMQEYVVGFDGSLKGGKDANTKIGRSAFTVHASRVIHFAENVLENPVFGLPRMERVYNILDDLLKVTGGSAETFWLTANRGLHIDVDKEMEMAPGDEQALTDEVDEYSNELRRVIRTRGVKVTSIGSDTPDPSGVFKMLMSVLSGASGIPQRIIIGSEAGQLASDQDRANWSDRIDERRANFGNPRVVFPLIKNLTRSGYLPTSDSTEITVDWPNAFKMSPLENAQTSAQHARSATNFAKAIETMYTLNQGTPGTADTTTPDGTVVPGTPEVPGADLGELITVEEARKMMWLDKPPVTFDSGADVGEDGTNKGPRPNPQSEITYTQDGRPRVFNRRLRISIGQIMRM